MTPYIENLTATFKTNLDLSRLERVCQVGTKLIARCPACAAVGSDKKGKHLIIYESGKFGCVLHQNDKKHNSEIFSLVGNRGTHERDPERERLRRKECVANQRSKLKELKLVKAAKAHRDQLITDYSWGMSEVFADCPQTRNGITTTENRYDPRHFLSALFPADAVIWTGAVYETGCKWKHASHWRTCSEWASTPNWSRIGPMLSPAIWHPGTVSRSMGNIISSPYVILDFDGFDGVNPETPPQRAAHLRASFAIIRWLREKLHWKLAAILWTGNKSLHAWFHRPSDEVISSLKNTASALGMDEGLIDHPEHPGRLPGHRHEKSGTMSRILWLQTGPI